MRFKRSTSERLNADVDILYPVAASGSTRAGTGSVEPVTRFEEANNMVTRNEFMPVNGGDERPDTMRSGQHLEDKVNPRVEITSGIAQI